MGGDGVSSHVLLANNLAMNLMVPLRTMTNTVDLDPGNPPQQPGLCL